MKINKKTSTAIFLSLSILSYCGSLVCAVFSGSYFQSNPSQALTKLIDDECSKQNCGEALFGTVNYYNEGNISNVNSAKASFDEILYNQLSKAEFNAKISCLNYIGENITILESNYYDSNYDTMHIYSSSTWKYFKENNDVVYISSELEELIMDGTGAKSASGQKITILVNGVTKTLTIGGTYLTGIYPKNTGYRCRGDGLKKAFGESIIMHEDSLLQFKPTKAISMFSTGSSNNGNKYSYLKNFSYKNNFAFDFNYNAIEGSTLNNDISAIENYYLSNNRITMAILLLFLSIILTVVFYITFPDVLKNINLRDECKKRNNVITGLISLSIILISAIIFIIFKFSPLKIGNAEIPMINLISTIIAGVITLAALVYILFRQKRIVVSLFKEKENNSEFNY